MFCALHDQLASLGRHAQLTRCFSAVAELLVFTVDSVLGLVAVVLAVVVVFEFEAVVVVFEINCC